MRDAVLLFYCTLVGYVASGITASFFRLVTSKPARFTPLSSGYVGTMSTFALCALTGPAIIVEMAVTRSLPRENTPAWFAGCVVVALLWSACSGVVLVALMYSIGNTI
jgi:hypothetical protein